MVVTILTDGAENASKEFTASAIKSLIAELKTAQWTFTYIGADHDVEAMAFSISIENTMVFKKNDADIKVMFDLEKSARASYSEKIRNKEAIMSEFYNLKKGKKGE